MREIKFRAWDKTREQMINVDMLLNTENGMQQYRVTRPMVNGCLDVEFVKEDTILMQYTGLKDKNGIEIYEGDILKQVSSDGESILHIVKYDDNDAKFIAKNLKLGDDYTCGINKNWLLKKEVIGNIYENPELLN